MNKELSELNSNIDNLVQDVIVETDSDRTRDLIDIFNWNIAKKNVIRLNKLNKLFDNVTDRISERFEKKPDQFSNDDLLNYMKAIQNAIDTSNKYVDDIEVPPPQVIQNNTQINFNLPSLSKESRDRILAAVNSTLANSEKINDIIIEDTNDEH